MSKYTVVRIKVSTLRKLRALFKKDRHTSYPEFFDSLERYITHSYLEDLKELNSIKSKRG